MDAVWVTRGVLSNLDNQDTALWENVAGSDVDCLPGSSGSGVYDDDGNLIGVLVGTYGDLTFIVDIKYVWDCGDEG